MNIMIAIAAAYSASPILTYLWKSGAQLFAVLKVTATKKVPTHPMTEYRNEAKEVFSCDLLSSCTLERVNPRAKYEDGCGSYLRLMEIDNRVEQRKDLSGKCGNIFHCPVMRIEYCQ